MCGSHDMRHTGFCRLTVVNGTLGFWGVTGSQANFGLSCSRCGVRLEETFLEDEIWTAISGLNSDKAPSPDGFPLAFWAFSWDFVKTEVLGFYKEFHKQARFVKNLNVTFLVLIPKKRTVEDFKDLRPISLVGVFTRF